MKFLCKLYDYSNKIDRGYNNFGVNKSVKFKYEIGWQRWDGAMDFIVDSLFKIIKFMKRKFGKHHKNAKNTRNTNFTVSVIIFILYGKKC